MHWFSREFAFESDDSKFFSKSRSGLQTKRLDGHLTAVFVGSNGPFIIQMTTELANFQQLRWHQMTIRLQLGIANDDKRMWRCDEVQKSLLDIVWSQTLVISSWCGVAIRWRFAKFHEKNSASRAQWANLFDKEIANLKLVIKHYLSVD